MLIVFLYADVRAAVQVDRGCGRFFKAIAGDEAIVETDELDGWRAGPEKGVAGDDDIAEGWRTSVVRVRMHGDCSAAWLWIHIDKRVACDRDVMRYAAFDIGEVAVDLDAAALSREEAVADRTRTGLDQ